MNLTGTPRAVACEVDRARWEQRSRFRLVTVTPGVVDEADDENADAQVEVSQDGPQDG